MEAVKLTFAEKVGKEFADFALSTDVDADLLATYTRIIIRLTFEESTTITSEVVKNTVTNLVIFLEKENKDE